MKQSKSKNLLCITYLVRLWVSLLYIQIFLEDVWAGIQQYFIYCTVICVEICILNFQLNINPRRLLGTLKVFEEKTVSGQLISVWNWDWIVKINLGLGGGASD